MPVGAIACDIDAWDGSLYHAAVFWDYVAFVVSFEDISESLGAWGVADGDEDSFAGDGGNCVSFDVTYFDTGSGTFIDPEDFLYYRIPDGDDFLMREGAFGHDG